MINNWIDQSSKLVIWLDEESILETVRSIDKLSDWNASSNDLLRIVGAYHHMVRYTPDLISEQGAGSFHFARNVPVPEAGMEGFPAFLRPALRSAIFKTRILDSDSADPKVTVMICTYKREQSCIRAIESVLDQTYKNIRCIVAKDGPGKYQGIPDDPRVEFYDLPRRGKYPADPEKKWHIAGREPGNYALALTEGPILCILDDDDLYLPEHIETIVDTWQQTKAHVIYTEPHTSDQRKPFEFDFDRERLNRENFIFSCTTAYCGAAITLVHTPPYAGIPADWAALRRISDAGLTFQKVSKVTTIHGDETLTRRRKEHIQRLLMQQGLKQ